MSSILKHVAVAALASCAAGFSLPTSAVTLDRDDVVAAAGACVPNVSSPDIRYSVAGIKNVGTASVYISCSVKSDWHGVGSGGTGTGVSYAGLIFKNVTGAATTLRCTLNPGYSYDGVAISGGSYPLSKVASAGTHENMSWYASTLIGSGARFQNFNLSCSLPPGVTLTFVEVLYDEDVGA